MAAAASNNTPAIIRRFLVLPNRMPPNFPHGTFSDAVSVGKEAISEKEARPGTFIFLSAAWLGCRSDEKCDDAAVFPRRSCNIPGLLCVWDIHASSGLRRSLLPLAFDFENSSDMVEARLIAKVRRI